MVLMNGHGGARPGAGRPRQDPMGKPRRRRSVYCTEDELEKIRTYLRLLRGGAVMKSFLESPSVGNRALVDHFVAAVDANIKSLAKDNPEDNRIFIVVYAAVAVIVHHVAGASFRESDGGDLVLEDAAGNALTEISFSMIASIEGDAINLFDRYNMG